MTTNATTTSQNIRFGKTLKSEIAGRVFERPVDTFELLYVICRFKRGKNRQRKLVYQRLRRCYY